MVGEHLEAQARRVVTGVDDRGKSYVVSDEPTPHRLALAGNTKCEMWRFPELPARSGDGDGLEVGTVEAQPPVGGLIHRVVTFPPDTEWDRSQGYADSSGALTAAGDPNDEGIPGLHATDSVDIITVIKGELVCQLQANDVVLKEGDTLVQRGTKHSWSNRTQEPTTIVAVLVSTVPTSAPVAT